MGIFSSLFGDALAIDLGTANTLVYSRRRGLIINEPSLVIVDTRKYQQNRVKAVTDIGLDAAPKANACHDGIKAIRPMQDGVIADFDLVECMLRHFIGKAKARGLFSRPKVVVSVPCKINQVERRAVYESVYSAGASHVELIEEPMAAAIGAGIDVENTRGCMVVDIGGGTTEVAVISLSGIVYAESIRIGGHRMDLDIINYIRKKYNVLIGEGNAEKLKIHLGSALELDEQLAWEAPGRNLVDGNPIPLLVVHDDVREALADSVHQILMAIHNVLENTPPDLAGSIIEHGIILTGGGAQLKKLDELVRDSTSLPVTIAEDPLTCVVRGAGRLVEDWSLLQKVTSGNRMI